MIKHKKKKGSDFEREIAKDLQVLDPNAKRMVLSGAVKGLETDIWTKLPFAFELKRQERLNLYRAFQQAIIQSIGGRVPVLVVKSSNKPTLACMKWEDWLNLTFSALKGGYER